MELKAPWLDWECEGRLNTVASRLKEGSPLTSSARPQMGSWGAFGGALCFLLLLSCSPISVPSSEAAPTDTLSKGQFIKDGGETLVALNGTFELGFFSPGSSRNRYVAIWYHGLEPVATIWVANKDHPLKTTSGSFGVSPEDGSLVVLDGDQTVVWSTNSSFSAETSRNTSSRLLDSGNLILQTSSGAMQWQSFDNPTDTFLPGMKITMGDEKSQLFSSWRSPDDPGTGRFSIGLDPRGSAQIYMWEGSTPRWRSGQWNGQAFIGTRMRSLYLYGFKLTTDDVGKKRYFTFSTFNSSLYRFVLQPDGVENTTILVEGTREWREIWSEPTVECEIYNHCGSNAVCDDQSGTPKCRCLTGYEEEGGGCVRRSRWRCEGGEEEGAFERVGGLKLPDFADWASTTGDEASCREVCARNCSCRGYAFAGGIGCMLWARDLVDIHQSYGLNTNDLYLKVTASDIQSKRRTKMWVVAVIISVPLLVVLILMLCTWLLRCKCRAQMEGFLRKRKMQKQPSLSISDLDFQSYDFSSASDMGHNTKSPDLPIYSFDTIAAATQFFSISNKLGQGGFGDVFRGVLPWGQEVAVKRLSRTSGQGLEEFKNEAMLIAKLQHRNLVRLLGCCTEKDEKILVYEYMPNKSLDAFIFANDAKRAHLDWHMRFSIIEGIARGLLYLHHDSRLRIVHRDLKASNILLDDEMNPKISDFGMARIFGTHQNQGNTNHVVGTFGYMSPEYAMEGLFSVKSDVYSFGILILEIINGRKNSTFSKSEHGTNLVGYAWKLWSEDRAMEMADPAMGDSISPHEVLRCIHAGLLCIQDKVTDRPTMSSVVLMLGSEATILATPRRPTYTLEGGPSDHDTMLPFNAVFTSSDVTITGVDVR